MSHRKQQKHQRVPEKSKRKKMLAELESRYPHYNIISNILGFFFSAGVVFTIWEIYIFRQTFILLPIALLIWILPGIILTPVLWRILNIYVFNQYSPGHLPLPFQVFYNIVSWGGIILFGFMWTNYHFASEITKDVSVTVRSSGRLAKGRHGCEEPYVTVSYQNQIKDIFFPCGTPVERYKLVNLEIAKGFFGFEVIKDLELKDGGW